MKIDLLCSSQDHPINPWLVRWREERAQQHEIRIVRSRDQLKSGDILFLISCAEMIPEKLRTLYGNCVVLHASDLPKGRGWSPHVWAILEGARIITVSAINAEDRVDSGDIWAKKTFNVAPNELYNEINASLFEAEITLMDQVIRMVENSDAPHPQPDEEATYYPRRTPRDSKLDPSLSIAEQFDKIRVSDPNRFPAFFEMHGTVFSIKLTRVESDD
ncbi:MULTISPECIES: formyltransferase family protein [Roseinatronobacter]|uniref:UDP-glucuronic acid dehydrogenase n=1 Tax=Roseinatronobacter domitianus TaxID=2940293 RepID=A0ABT0M6W7_9RHOB|nr:formyltransferase family protein [Roseibaca sp.]MCL1630049.1 UDP-glucuronic acid dehydrogenase [Roseibaca domitiana]